MSTVESSGKSNDEPRTGATGKRPYQKPAFRYEQVFVTTALSCGKIDPTQDSCRGLNNKVS